MNQSVKKLWETKGQEMELQFHQSGSGDWRWNSGWVDARITLQTTFNFNFSEFEDQELLDIGCGPRSMLEWWDGKVKYGIDPLSTEYLKINSSRVNSFGILDKVINRPAEELVKELVNSIDFIWTHNALDHCYDWESVLFNANSYLKSGGKIYIGTDTDKPPNPNHPGIQTKQALLNKVNSFGWTIIKRHDRLVNDPVWLRTVGLIAIKP